jgi:hypothetical protein
VAGAVVAVVALCGLGVQSFRGDRTVGAQLAGPVVRNAEVDNAYYHCLDVQTRSLVAPGQTVSFTGTDPYSVITLLQAVGSWITVADPPSGATARLSLLYGQGHGCLGTVVVAYYAAAHGGPVVRVGSGDEVAGNGPPPPSPL